MKNVMRYSIAIMLLLGLSPVALADSVIQIYPCKVDADVPEDVRVDELATAWLAAARNAEGGADLNLSIEFPIAAGEEDNVFNWILQAPDVQTWATFMEGYQDSEELAAIDKAFYEVITCKGNSLWISQEIE